MLARNKAGGIASYRQPLFRARLLCLPVFPLVLSLYAWNYYCL